MFEKVLGVAGCLAMLGSCYAMDAVGGDGKEGEGLSQTRKKVRKNDSFPVVFTQSAPVDKGNTGFWTKEVFGAENVNDFKGFSLAQNPEETPNLDALTEERLGELRKDTGIVAPNISDVLDEELMNRQDNFVQILSPFAKVTKDPHVREFFNRMLNSLSKYRDACSFDVPDGYIPDEDFDKVVSFYDLRIELLEGFLDGNLANK